MSKKQHQAVVTDTVDVDIAVVGAGLVGLPLALALNAQGWVVALIDAATEPVGACESASASSFVSDTALNDFESQALKQRCTALNSGTQQWLVAQGLWQSVAGDACPIKKVNVSHKGYFGATRLSADELSIEALGYVVNNAAYVQQLNAVCANTTVKRFYNTRVNGVSHLSDAVQLSVEGAPNIRAKLLIAADGITSVVRDSTGIATSQVDYEQAAVLGMIKLDSPHEGVAHERFTPSGPLALLPRPGLFMNFVDCIDPHEQTDIEAMSDAAYLQRLQTRFGYRLGRFSQLGPRFVTPLLRIESNAQTATRTVLLGNAMRLLHPVGGQGYNLAIRDVDALVKRLSTELAKDPGDEELLTAFAAQRQRDQKSIVRLTDLLAKGFRGRASIPGHLRSGALLGLDAIAPLRKRFAAKTMGITDL